MLAQILQFILEVISGLVTGACLLRIYMQMQRVPFQNSVGKLIFALSDWIVMPLRRIIPARSNFDLSSLTAAILIQLIYYGLVWVMQWMMLPMVGNPVLIPALALFGLVRMVITGLIGILLIYAILSWVQPYAPVAEILRRLSDPVLKPLRRVIPLVGGVDLSALVALVILQIALMVLMHMQVTVLGGLALSSVMP